jgi:hypothetical protein
MALSAFDDRSRPPQPDELARVLGGAAPLWEELRRRLASRFDPLAAEWGFSSAKTGWGLRLKQGKRTVLYMTPCAGCFVASLALGEKAVKAAHESDLPAAVLAVVDGAVKYAEGRGVRLEVGTVDDVASVEKLAAVKMCT